MGSQIGSFSRFPYNRNETRLARSFIKRVILIDAVINFVNGPLFCYAPSLFQITDVRNVLVRALMVRLIDASHFVCCHMHTFRVLKCVI